MPPKARFTREEIVSAAFALLRERGVDALSSRELGARLGSSARPIFTVFQSMQEVHEAVLAQAKALFDSYLRESFCYTPVFKQIGMQWIRFAREEPNLYRLLFMTKRAQPLGLGDIPAYLGETLEGVLLDVQKEFALTREEARQLYTQMILHAHGIAALCVSGAGALDDLDDLDIAGLFGEACFGMVMYMKNRRGAYDPQSAECRADPARIPERRKD